MILGREEQNFVNDSHILSTSYSSFYMMSSYGVNLVAINHDYVFLFKFSLSNHIQHISSAIFLVWLVKFLYNFHRILSLVDLIILVSYILPSFIFFYSFF